MNIPYRKVLNENGVIINPIAGSYPSSYPNRRLRRQKPERFRGNGKNFPLTVIGKLRYLRVVQEIVLPDGSIKRVGHYVLRTSINKSIKRRKSA